MSQSSVSPSPASIDVVVVRGRGEQALLYVLVVVLGAGFGLQYASARMMGLAGVEPLGALLIIHVGLSAAFLAVSAAARKLFRPSWQDVLFFAVMAVYTNLGQLGVELFAAHHVPAGELTLIVSLLPVFVLVIAGVFRTERLTYRKSGGMMMGVGASLAILLPNGLQGGGQLFWVGIAFLAPLSQAVGMVLMGLYWPRRLEPMQVATGNLVMGTLLLTPMVMLLHGDVGLHAMTGEGGVATALFGLTVAAEFYIFAMLLRRGGAVLASSADFIAVCAGLVFGYLLFAEVPTVWMAAAAMLCLLALKFVTDRTA